METDISERTNLLRTTRMSKLLSELLGELLLPLADLAAIDDHVIVKARAVDLNRSKGKIPEARICLGCGAPVAWLAFLVRGQAISSNPSDRVSCHFGCPLRKPPSAHFSSPLRKDEADRAQAARRDFRQLGQLSWLASTGRPHAGQ